MGTYRSRFFITPITPTMKTLYLTFNSDILFVVKFLLSAILSEFPSLQTLVHVEKMISKFDFFSFFYLLMPS